MSDYNDNQSFILFSIEYLIFPLKIERLQNMGLYSDYMATKERMRAANQGTVVEQRLWHEASPASIKRINKHGFGRSQYHNRFVILVMQKTQR